MRGKAVHCLLALLVAAALAGRKADAQQSTADSNRSRLSFGGDAYAYEYLPFGITGARPKIELYALSLLANVDRGPWLMFVDYRFRTSKLRPFYPSTTWVQQAYIGYRTPIGRVRIGSFYRRVGLAWDGSFCGNIEYFDGLMLDPELGFDVSGTHSLTRRWGLDYSVQYFATDSGVNGSLAGRDFVSEPGARLRNEWTTRLAPIWKMSRNFSLTAGASFANGTIRRSGLASNIRRQWAADATLAYKDWLVYGEVMDQRVYGPVAEAPQNATYTLFGTRLTHGRILPRFNYSSGAYHGLNRRREYILQPGVTIALGYGLSVIVEYNFWRETAVAHPKNLDRSLNLVLWYHF